ncbi:MAG: DUF2304 domain-containing protein [Lachnospiraceae bacterium]|jgi:hypothetical protein|nr:DUF2304 domain-containing protein [Lachnospiraceae bacterium]
MSPQFRIVMLVIALIAFIFVFRRIGRAQMKVEDALYWFLVVIILGVFSVFPEVTEFFARILGIYSSLNFTFATFIGLLLLRVFLQSIQINKLEKKQEILIQKYAIDNCEHNRPKVMPYETSDKENAEENKTTV